MACVLTSANLARRRRLVAGGLIVSSWFAAGCGERAAIAIAPAAPARAPCPMLSFGAFSSAREAFGVRILPRFAAQWRRAQGGEFTTAELYEGGGTLTQAIAGSFPADVAVLALTSEVEQLVRAGLVAPNWRDAPHQGIVSRSLVVLAVRKGNPLAIHDWTDLVRPGLRILTPDPRTSGGGTWNVCAIYGAAWRGHAGVPAHDAAAARAFVARVFAHVVEQHRNASESFRSFQQGLGDVAITYESEVTQGWLFGHDEARVIPPSTLLVESPAVVVDGHADRHGVRAIATALVQHLHSAEAQKQLAVCGLRPVDAAIAAKTQLQFPEPEDLWTIEDLGGWERAGREILVPAGFGAAAAGPGK